jgi:hypothetical protein
MSETFTYHGVELSYFWHLYNLTMCNERAVELAIVRQWLPESAWHLNPGGLEVGNVMGHYWPMRHTVFDLHEEPAWYQTEQKVLSVDLLTLSDVEHPWFPWVVSISTIEHTDDPIRALAVLHNLVAPGGSLLVTFPMGVSGMLDQLVLGGAPNFDRMCTIARTEDGWAQTEWPEIRPYGPWANSVFIGEWERPA